MEIMLRSNYIFYNQTLHMQIVSYPHIFIQTFNITIRFVCGCLPLKITLVISITYIYVLMFYKVLDRMNFQAELAIGYCMH